MSNTSIQLKKSGATGNTPTGLAFGEVAINYADGKLYYKNALGGTSYISNQFSFDTINANNSLILATGVSDTLSFVAGDNISIDTNTATKTIVISATSGGSTSSGVYANAAFVQANAAYEHANAAFNAANTGGSSTDSVARTTANAAFLQANSAYDSQNTTGTYANSAYTQANTATNNAAGASLYANAAFIQANAAFDKANSSSLGGFRANTLIVANSTGFLSNSNAEFSLANNTLYVVNATATNTFFANSVTFNDGTKLISASGIVASNAATANVAINARITNVTTGTYFPIVTDTTITGSDTFHYSSGDFLMYAANNTFRATGNVWAGQFIAVGTNIPVVNSTGHWIGQTINAIDSFARSTGNSAALYANGAFIQANAAFNKANTDAEYIRSGTSNVYFSGANGSIIANVAGNTIVTITANGFSTSGANGDISGANNIFSNFINVTSASIVSGVNVVPYIQSAFNKANNSLNANTGGIVTGNTVISNVDMANAIYSNVSFSVATQEDTPSAMSISADGKKMFVMGTTGDDVNEYELTTPWLVSSASFVRLFSVASQENFPTGLFFRPDGLKFYVVGQTNDTVYQYALTTPWDLSTASYESKSFSVSSQDNNPTGIFFRPNGLSMYVTGSSTDSVHQYTLSTAWDVSTATFLQSFSVASEETVPQDLSFANDGSRMFVMGNIGDDVNIYNLSTSWNVSTAVFSTTFSVAAQDDAPIGMFIEVDGSRFYMLGSSNDTVYQYRLPMATIEFTGNTFINGDINVLQNLNVDGSATFRNEIVSNNVISSNIYVSGYNVFTYITNAYIQANAAFAAANAGGAGTDQFARNTANAAFIQANAAFAVANTGGGGGSGTDNVARETANAAFIQANAAFDKANVGGGGSDLLVYTNLFTANGNTTTFGLSTTPQNKDYTIVNIDGVVQLKNTYSLSGNTIVLSEILPVNTTIEITVFGGGSVSEYYNRAYTGDNTTTTFAVTSGVTNNSIIVTENGIIQQPGVDYYVSGSNVIFTTAPSSTISIGIRELSRGVSNGSSANVEVGFVTQNKTVIDSNVTIGAGYSGISVGPLTIANNVVINIAAGQKWVIL